ncbi:WYL domain-containing protein [Salicola sp. Rm-C-2C1-2]|uniref:WYL domain-containing protein n=1 Tax=Salicola sp. Rm-C-2C1-2 TaxID=3141321 RepID=UPI0032E3C241
MMHLMESPMSMDQQIWNETTASFELTATVSDTQDLRWWLTAQGQHLDILAPDYLRATIIETMEEALGRQRSSG